MSKRLRNVGIGFLIAAAAQLLMGCDSNSGSANFIAGGAPTGVTGGGSSGGVTASSGVDSTQFNVEVVPVTGVTTLIHRSDVNEFDYSTPCSIPTSQITSGSIPMISCLIEGAELDLHVRGVSFQFNTPPAGCAYLEFSPPYYFKYPSGGGPSFVQYTVDPTGAVVDGQNSIQGQAYCPYDYSNVTLANGTSGPNCCTGSYVKSVTTGTQGPSGTTWTTSTSKENWGGSVANCLSGPAIDSQEKQSGGFPKSTLYFTDGIGVNQTYKVKAPNDDERSSNLYVANYYGNLGSLPVGFYPYNNVVHAYAPTGTYNGVNFGSYSPDNGIVTQSVYEFDCLDPAYELKAQILLSIRSWDLDSELGVATTYSPASPGTIGPGGIPIHRYAIWSDIENNAAFYPTGIIMPGAPSSNTWLDGFPGYNE